MKLVDDHLVHKRDMASLNEVGLSVIQSSSVLPFVVFLFTHMSDKSEKGEIHLYYAEEMVPH